MQFLATEKAHCISLLYSISALNLGGVGVGWEEGGESSMKLGLSKFLFQFSLYVHRVRTGVFFLKLQTVRRHV